jgi:hypothetical protein
MILSPIRKYATNLDVPMSHASGMEVLETQGELSKVGSGFLLFERFRGFASDLDVHQRTAGNVFEHEVQRVGRVDVDGFIEQDKLYVRGTYQLVVSAVSTHSRYSHSDDCSRQQRGFVASAITARPNEQHALHSLQLFHNGNLSPNESQWILVIIFAFALALTLAVPLVLVRALVVAATVGRIFLKLGFPNPARGWQLLLTL